jgi:hypothetical protein
MRSDLGSICQDARARIAVPPLPLAAIRAGAECRPLPQRGRRRKGLIAAVLAGVSVAAVAAAAEVLSGTHVSVVRSRAVLVSSDRLTLTKDPSAEELRAAARQAGFPVVLPAGLPAGTKLHTLALTGSSAVLLQYDLPGAWRRSNHVLTMVLADPKTLAADPNALATAPQHGRRGYVLELGGAPGRGAVRWIVGGEAVVVSPGALTPAELARIKRAMLARAGR